MFKCFCELISCSLFCGTIDSHGSMLLANVTGIAISKKELEEMASNCQPVIQQRGRL
jgi:hypothetical protein